MKRNINELAHITGTWWITGNPESTFSGYLFLSNENYHFICHTMTKVTYDKLKQVMPLETFNSDACLNGIVRGQQVSLIGCRHERTEYFSNPVEPTVGLFEVEIVPCEIIYGDFSVDTASVVTKVTVDYQQMNEFYNKSAFSGGFEGIKFLPNAPEKIELTPFNLFMYPVGTYHESICKHEYENTVKVDFLFHTPVLLEEARSYVAKFRLLLSLLKLNIITIDNIALFLNPDEKDSNCIYHMNYANDKIDEIWPVSFFSIRYEDISDIFGCVIKNWLMMFADAEPIMELFYQTLTKKSYDVNKFLNLAQAIEVYSCRYRKDSVNEVCKLLPNDNSNDTSPKLYHRAYDLLNHFAPCTELCDDKNIKIARMICDTRNYFTHYGRKKRKKALTEFGSRNAVSDLMFYLLAFAIYYQLGMSVDKIKKGFRHPLYSSMLKRVNALFPKINNEVTE